MLVGIYCQYRIEVLRFYNQLDLEGKIHMLLLSQVVFLSRRILKPTHHFLILSKC